MKEDQRRHGQRGEEVRDEENTIRPAADGADGSCGGEGVHSDRGNHAGEDDGGKEAAEPEARGEEEYIVKDDVKEEEGVNEAAKDAVVAVQALMGGAEGQADRID